MASRATSSVRGSFDRFQRPRAGDRRRDLAGLGHDLVATLIPCLGDPGQHLAERRHPMTRLRRVVRPRVERSSVGREERRHRPAAVAGHRLHRIHVDAVQVGPFLPVHLDRDERRRSSTPRSLRPRRTRAPSRDTSGRPRSRSTGRSACLVHVPRSARPVPTGTSRPGCARVGGGRDWSGPRAGSPGDQSCLQCLASCPDALGCFRPPTNDADGCGDERGHPGLGGGREPGARAGTDPCAAPTRARPCPRVRCPTPPRPSRRWKRASPTSCWSTSTATTAGAPRWWARSGTARGGSASWRPAPGRTRGRGHGAGGRSMWGVAHRA